MHPVLLESLAKQRHSTMVEHAKRRHLRPSSEIVSPTIWERLCITVGNFLIFCGQSLKSKYYSPVCTNECECKLKL